MRTSERSAAQYTIAAHSGCPGMTLPGQGETISRKGRTRGGTCGDRRKWPLHPLDLARERGNLGRNSVWPAEWPSSPGKHRSNRRTFSGAAWTRSRVFAIKSSLPGQHLRIKELGATHLLSFSAVGSLSEDLPPRSIVLPDQIIDRTISRARTFFDEGLVVHVGLADPFCQQFSDVVFAAGDGISNDVRRHGIYTCIEGPQFSTRAESNLYRSWGASVIGMTSMPEARLAREAELCYVIVALVTDYDVWHETEADVNVETVMLNLRANADFAANLVYRLCESGLPERRCACDEALADAIVTAPRFLDASVRERYELFLGDRRRFS